MSPETGRKFGPYEIQSRIAGGGMGHVYLAWDARLHREVAVKLLNHEYAMPGMRERFLREARAASALNHPNICTIYDIGEQDGDPYLVMELLEGETLKDRIQSRTMSTDEIVAVARETAEALGAAHSKGVVHRDIKPANIFLVAKQNGGVQAKVLDFGLAKIDGGVLGTRGRSVDLTTAGATVGTLAYMSPEQARGEVLDSRSDLFSLGVVMYEMATRQVPFKGATSALVFVQLLNHPPEPIREWNESVPRELEKIILKLLAKERTARFQTAHELELALIALAEKGSAGGAGWLRKAVATVPLVRAPDPVAREKKPSRPAGSGSSAGAEPVRESPVPGPARRTPAPPSGRPLSPVPASQDTARPAADQFLRPVARVPRADVTPAANRSTPVPEGVPSTFQTAAESASARRGNDALPAAEGVLEAQASAPNPPSSRSSPTRPNDARQEDSIFGYQPGEPSAAVANKLVSTTPAPLQMRQVPTPAALPPGRGRRIHRGWLAAGAAVLAVVLIGLLILRRQGFGTALLTRNDAVVVTEIENRTGNKTLDGSVAEGLRIELAQSAWLRTVDGSSYRAAHRVITQATPNPEEANGVYLARRTAARLGTRAYLYGTITGVGAPYALHVDLHDVATNDILASAEAHADSLQQVPDAISQIAHDLRVTVGEPHASLDETGAALGQEGTSSLAALQLFSQAQELIATHQPVAAIADLQQATAADPKFVQAYLALALLYHQMRAETSAAESARLALASADTAGQRTRTLAQAAYDIEASGDLLHATASLRQLAAAGHDSTARAMLAETLWLEGRMSDALQAAQQAYAEDAFNSEAYAYAEAALIGLNRYDAAFQLDVQVQRLGLAYAGDSFTAAYVDGRQEVVDSLAAKVPVGRIEYRPDWSYGLYLDTIGRLAAGATLWRSRAGVAEQNDSLKSAAAYLLAQGAIDRALLGECAAALAMVNNAEAPGLPAGPVALFHLGMSQALCGASAGANQKLALLQQRFPQSFVVNGFYKANLLAALALVSRAPAEALNQLQPARPFDLISLTPYLRGRARVDLHQDDLGIVDFQSVLVHPGAPFLMGANIDPAAQIGLAHAFADSGDTGNSAQAYRRFLEMERLADPSLQAVSEARLHAGH